MDIASSAETNEHICKICSEVFPEKCELQRHLITHTLERRHKCDICHKAFIRISHLRDHYLSHTNIKSFICGVCSKEYARITNLVKHCKTHSESKVYDCECCGDSFCSRQELRTHYSASHANLKRYVCRVCSKAYSLRDSLRKHYSTHLAEKPHKCDVCNKGFVRKSKLNCHYYTHTQEKPYVCNICHKGFIQKINFVKHSNIHAKKENDVPEVTSDSFSDIELTKNNSCDKPYICNICHKGFVLKTNLIKHSNIHVKKEPIPEIVDDSPNNEEFTQNNSSDKPYICKICHKGFIKKYNLIKHSNIHAKKENNISEVISDSFSDKELSKNNSSHKPYLCKICSQNFNSESVFRRHLKYHKGKNLLTCDICKKTFLDKKAIKSHFSKHGIGKFNECDLCYEIFGLKANLNEHYRTHLGISPDISNLIYDPSAKSIG